MQFSGNIHHIRQKTRKKDVFLEECRHDTLRIRSSRRRDTANIWHRLCTKHRLILWSAGDLNRQATGQGGGIVPLRNGRLSGLRPLEPPVLKRSGSTVTCLRVLPAPCALGTHGLAPCVRVCTGMLHPVLKRSGLSAVALAKVESTVTCQRVRITASPNGRYGRIP